MQKPAQSAYVVLILLALMVVVPMASLVKVSLWSESSGVDTVFWQSHYLRSVFFFSLWQAFLSTLLSVGLALAVARAFARLGQFPCRNLLLRLFGLPLVVPAVVAVLGIVSVYGSDGWAPLGRDLYGLNGILLAHLFFNLPLAVRLLLPAWFSIPEQHWQLGQQLQFTQMQQWRYLEWPALRESLPGVCLLIFMLCLTSFAVVLTLGGGPKSTTLEVAIYQSLRFDFDPLQAVMLALLQFMLCAIIAFINLHWQKLPEVEIMLPSQAVSASKSNRQFDFLLMFLSTLFIATPLLALLFDGLTGPVIRVLSHIELWRSAALSVAIGLVSAVISVVTGWLILRTTSDLIYLNRVRFAASLELSAQVIYVVPPLVLGTGLFILIMSYLDVFAWAIPIVILINALMGLPFVIRALGPPMRQSKMRYRRLCESLSLSGWHRFKLIEWPMLRRPIGLAMALVTALAMGDLGVIALFGTPETTTLPLMLYHQLAAYLMDEAAVTAIFLLSACLLMFWLLERLLGGRQPVW